MVDLLIIGAGPSALSAAIYSGRDGMNVVVYEKELIGGLAATTYKINNYPGFPEGINGIELANKLELQAKKYNANIKFGEITKINHYDQYNTVVIDNSETVKCKTILIASGNRYAKLNIPNEDKYYGKGVHYCATCDGSNYRNKNIIVVGAGNSAIQEVTYLSQFVNHIDLVVHSVIKSSHVLSDKLAQLESDGKVKVYSDVSPIKIIDSNEKVTGLEIEENNNKKIIELKADGIFVFVGLKPNTDYLKDSEVKLDKNGAIITNESTLMTNIDGIFACGDVRSGATKQIATAVGDGARAAVSIRRYLKLAKN